MKREETDSDSQFDCPMCGAAIKIFADPDENGVVLYGCSSCGYLASFVARCLEDFIERRLEY